MKEYGIATAAIVIAVIVTIAVVGGGAWFLLSKPGENRVPTTGTPPSAPTGVSAAAGNGQVTITWSSVSGATSYNLYMAQQSGVTKTNYSTKTGGTKYTNVTSLSTRTGLTNGTTYYFVVTAVNSAGEGSESSEVSATPQGAVGLTNDFQPCSGKPSNPSYVEGQRLLLATSDGLNFTRTNTKLSDRGSVSDAVVLNNGRILVYFVIAGKIVNGVETKTNETVVAVSDDNGSNWVYKNVTFNGVSSGATPPVDPNVVLKPDGTLRLFTTIDLDGAGPQKACTYSFLSTDGGFTYNIEEQRFSVSGQDVLDPETFRFSDTNWKIWAGNRHATSTDGNTFTDQGTVTVATDGGYPVVIADITDFSTTTPLYRMYVHSGVPATGGTQIKSLTSTNSTTWTLESGARLTLDTSAGLESSKLCFPTVVRLKNGTYLMVYETTIP